MMIKCYSAGVSALIKTEMLPVCWVRAFRCVLTQYQGGKTMSLEKQLLLPINLRRVSRPFPNHVEFMVF